MRTWIINLVACVAVALAVAGLARGETVTLAWDASVSTNVAGYRVYWGTNSRAYFGVTNAGLVLTQTVTAQEIAQRVQQAQHQRTAGQAAAVAG